MSQSATLYRISPDTFGQLVKSDNPKFDIASAKSHVIFQGSFMGLEYILSKGQDASTIELVREIFNPRLSLGGQDFSSLTPEEQFEFYESGGSISYLDMTSIRKLNNFLEKVSETDIQSKYDAQELNDNRIYPEVWHNDNSPDQAYKQPHILEDLEELKAIVNQADKQGDYIFVFVG
jgi:hypothetical protein